MEEKGRGKEVNEEGGGIGGRDGRGEREGKEEDVEEGGKQVRGTSRKSRNLRERGNGEKRRVG